MITRKSVGWLCAWILIVLIMVGVFFPTLGAGSGFGVQLSALVFYVLLLVGAFWGFLA